MSLDESVAELLEQGERAALAKDAAKTKQEPSDSKQNDNADRYSAEREQNDARRFRRSHRNDDDKVSTKGDSSDSATSNRRSRDSDRERDHDRDRGHRYSRRSSRDRDYRGSYSRRGDDGGNNYYRPGGRYNDDRPPSRGYRSATSRSPRYQRHGGRDGDRGARRRSPPPPRKPKTPEVSEEERDRRTVFVQQLAQRLRTRELKEFFEQVGEVAEAQIVRDKVTHTSKGIGYVEFTNEDSVPKALELVGKKLLGIPIIVQLTEAEKNRQAKTEGSSVHNGVPFHRLYVGNVHFGLEERELTEVFAGFGELEFVQLQRDDIGRSKGYGFVQYTDPAAAKKALETLNGFVLGDRPIRVGLGSDKFTTESTAHLLTNFASKSQAQAQPQGSSFSGAGGRGAHAGGSAYFDRAGNRNDAQVGGASALDDSDVGGVNMSNYSRHALMTSLSRSHQPETKSNTVVQPKPAVAPATNPPSRCIVIKNMYTAAAQEEPHWKDDLIQDVKDESAQSYGAVVHIDVPAESARGEVFVKFKEVAGATKAYQGMNGRFYDNQMLEADYMVEAVYSAKFPKSKNL